ncbi:MAG: magnesium/cobalt transporter CorA [Desulfobacterales bacterium]|nr:magnesium/cobalt transporter CorA [Desulfobacterales bacterium]MCF8078902.1 magnesium/cobalt transporter CorA [Desulfobacterales bacterium]
MRFIKKSSKKAGTSPGTLVHVGDERTEPVRLYLIDYDEGSLIEREISGIEAAASLKDRPTVTWINADGIHDIELMEKIGARFGIHPLTLEDIVNTGQRPKLEDFEDYLYLVFKMLSYDAEAETVRSEQISLVVGENFVFSFQEAAGDVFDLVRERIRKGKGRIRKAGSGYLAYALIDAVVDHYYAVLETVGAKIEEIEEQLMEDPEPEVLETIHELKREMIFSRKQVWPVRELLSGLTKSDSPLVHESTGIYFTDVYDHAVQVIDTIESFRDMLSSMLDLYLSTISNRMNEVMKMLTIIATIFIPLTFIAGIYGMNFDFMPELHWRWGYFAVWGVMLAVVLVLLVYFKRKRWL